MPARLAAAFPFVLAAVLPLVGLILAVLRFTEDRRHEAGMLLAASLLGAFVYALILG
jgi:hypothetical protein